MLAPFRGSLFSFWYPGQRFRILGASEGNRSSFVQTRQIQMKQYFILIGTILTLLHPHPTSAHNGAVAIAVPVEGIVVDGKGEMVTES